VRRFADAGALAAIAAVFAIGAMWVHPLRDVPVIDDWTYAWSVEHLLRTGELRVAEISSVYPIVQILWGALFARVFGFSFGVLRVSTVIVAIAGCWAMYYTLRELRCSRAWSLAGALAVAVHPVYFALSFSFMTDVPVTAVAMLAILFTVQAMQRDSPSRLWVAGLFALIAFLIRATAVVLPLTAIVTIDWRRVDRARWAAPVVATLAALAVAWVALHRQFGPLDAESGRLEQLQWLTLVTPFEYIDWNIGMFWQAAVPFAPLLLASSITSRGWRIVAVAAIVAGLLLRMTFGHLPFPLPDWETWSLQDIGGGRVLIGGGAPVSAWSTRAAPFVSFVGLVTASALIVALGSLILRRSRAAAVLLAFGLLNLGIINAFWLYNDRYDLVLAPTLACAAAWWASRVHARVAIVSSLIAVLWTVSVTGTRDMLDVNETAGIAARDLEAEGVPAWDVDGGWALNGWRLWAHPERLPAGTDRSSAVPFVTSKVPTTYKISSRPLPDYDIVRELPLQHAWWQATDRVYVLRRRTTSHTGA
jgi:hypothetical protein